MSDSKNDAQLPNSGSTSKKHAEEAAHPDTLTTTAGRQSRNNQNSVTAGPRRPVNAPKRMPGAHISS